MSVKYSDLLPHQFRARLAQRPLAYLPLGTLEWHGEQMALGADAIISEAFMVQCAEKYGGIVLPPIHAGPDLAKLQSDGSTLIGMDTWETTTPNRPLDGSCYWVPDGLFQALLDAILTQLKRAGFKAVFADGHGPSRKSWSRDLAERERRFGLKLLGVTEGYRAAWACQTDHAGKNETSLVMAVRPALVDIKQLGDDRGVFPQGVIGKDPRDASAEHGEECYRAAMALFGEMLKEKGV